jgi:predicted alpha/beta superfamily hydrolase|tara:strand:- start:865 stop:2013 length:1149 start_codon:yes stop_codon:yes gene_type:complete
MKIKTIVILTLLISKIAFSQGIDTLTFHSKAFNESRTVFIHKPKFYKYQSDSVKLPVIYVLDGQNEWFINPLLSDIEYLQYTKEIPNAIIVVIPHKNRRKECGIISLETELPLDKFITEELDEELKKYNLNEFKVIIGHSFSASFSLYSFFKNPKYYSAVLANTPLDKMQMLVEGFEQNKNIDKTKISISIGGIAHNKDIHHRNKYEALKIKFSEFFNSINTFEADYSAHNGVSIVASPALLTKIFKDYSSRYSEIAKVDLEYKLINKPNSIPEVLDKIEIASKIGDYYYPPEIPDINGIASRYWNSNFDAYAAKIYEIGIAYYPNYYDFYVSLYELNKGKVNAEQYLNKAKKLLLTVETDWIERDEVLKEIEAEKIKNGWQ